MSSAARWSLRLPRTGGQLLGSKLPRGAIRRVEQRRWVQRQPTKRRAWATMPQKSNENNPPIERSGQHQEQSPQDQEQQTEVGRNTQLASTLAQSDNSDLVTEVHIPKDPHGVIPPDHPALAILGNSSLVIQRQIEMMNLMLGFEQANRYIIMDGQGQTLGYIAERDHGIGSTMARQMFRTHRSFTTHIFDAREREVLRIHRPFAYINSRIRIYDPIPEGGYSDTETSTALQGTSASSAVDQTSVAQVSPLKLEDMRIIGEAQQQWAPLRRKYNLFTYRALSEPPESDNTPRLESGDRPTSSTTALTTTEGTTPDRAIEAGMAQFAHINEPFLSWTFTLRDAAQRTIGNVSRNFGGFAREIFTDTGVYALRMDSAAQSSALETAEGEEVGRYEREATALTLDQRAVMLASAVSVDFDYFSRHSHAGGGYGFMPIFWPMGGGAAEGGAAGAAGEAGAVGAASEAGALEGAAGRGVAAESGIAGAGSMAGYEAMQRGADNASPQAAPPEESFPGASGDGGGWEQAQNRAGSDDVWGSDNDPWGGGGGGGPPGEGGGGGGWMDTISDFFED